jgi:hypothetical protein
VKVIRKFAVQGHPVPDKAHHPVGPFPAEVLKQPQMEVVVEHSDSLHEALDEYRLFRCRDCGEVLGRESLNIHECEEIEEWQ